MARVDDAKEAAEEAGLIYVSDDTPGLSRERRGDGFAYRRAKGDLIDDDATIERIRKLAIPPAWNDVWICPKSNGHLQATGRDARGRKQYRYHPEFRQVRDSTKYEHMLEFARSLPAIRERIAGHMALRGLPREKVLATVVHLLETTLIRVGNDEYTKDNKSYGLTTLRNPHVSVEGSQLKFRFKGKSGKAWNLQLRDRRVAKIVRACQDLPGQRLFEYIDEDGQLREVASADVNAYLREITGRDVTAKDFRTWAGTVMAALALREIDAADSPTGVKKNIKAAIESVAARLGNTPTICRKCYVHPEVLDCYAQGDLQLDIGAGAQHEEHAEEMAVLSLLERRLSRTLEDQLGDQLEESLDRARCAARQARRKARVSASGRRGSFQ
jgi:DNA topoisomerase I